MNFDPVELIKLLQEKWGSRPCPMCNSASFVVNNVIFQLTEFHTHGTVIGGPVNPVVPVTCTNCGNTILVNAMVTGAVPPQPQPQGPPPTKEEAK